MRHSTMPGCRGRTFAGALAALTWTLGLLGGAASACSSSESGVDSGRGGAGMDAREGRASSTDAGKDRRAPRDASFERTSDATDDRDEVAPPDAGIPSLVALTVTGSALRDAAPALTLLPPFSPDVHDYFVLCADGPNPLTVSMKASPNAASLLVMPMASPARPSQTLSLTVFENQAVVAAATNPSFTVEYWIRCLPHDFPPMQLVAHAEAGAPPPGYYLLGSAQPRGGARSYAMVLDRNGVPVWYVQGVVGDGVGDVDDNVPGTISFFSGLTAPWQVHTLSPWSTAYVTPSGTQLDLHELLLLPDGNYLVVANPVRYDVDLTGLGLPLPDGGAEALGPHSVVNECELVEFEPSTGTIRWSWEALHHFDPAQDSTLPTINGFVSHGRPVIDVFHCNSIDIDPDNGNLLVSARNMDSVFYMERSTGKVLWKMGGKTYTKDDAGYVPVTDAFYRQHDARLQPGWSACWGRGQVSMFDDHTGVPGVARGVVYDVVVGARDGGPPGDCGAPDGSAGDAVAGATVAWQYLGPSIAADRGSFRITADGSRVIGWGDIAAPKLVFTEVDDAGADLLDFYFTDSDESYRVIKVPLTDFDIDVLRATAGRPY